MTRVCVLALLALLVVSLPGAAEEVELRYVDPVTDLTGGCYLQGMQLQPAPPEGALGLANAARPLYGALKLAGSAYPVAVDMGSEPAQLYLDADQDGELIPIAWERSEIDDRYRAQVTLDIYYDEDAPRAYSMFVVWNPWIPTLLIYCRGAYYEGTIDLGGTAYRLAVLDEDTDGLYDDLEAGTLYIDADLDGELTTSADSHEAFSLLEPFNLGGVTYQVVEVRPDGSLIRIEESDLSVAPKHPLGVGHPAPPFEATTLSGDALSLEGLAGSIVVLDFWAAWCAPCVAELPTMVGLHELFHERGVEVLGINLDRTREAFENAVTHYELEYTHVYDGDDETISTAYRIVGIPMTYILDRDGTIVARGLGGEALRDAVEALLEEEVEGEASP